MYNVGDKFTSKYFTDFEIINIFEHYKGTVIVTFNEKGEYSARSIKKLDELVEKGTYKLVMGQISMGTTI